MLLKTKKILEKIKHSKQYIWLTLRRGFLGGSVLEYLIVALFFSFLTFMFTNFVVLDINSKLFIDGAGDGTAGFLWLNYVDKGLDLILSKTDFVNYPYGEALGSASFITYSTLWIPLRFFSYIFGPIAGLNIVTFSGFFFSAFAMYWLIKKLTNSKLVSLFAGYAVAFTPYAIYKSSGHLAYIFSVVFVLIIAAFIGFWKKPTLLRSIIFAGTIAFAFYTDGYYILLAAVLVFSLVFGGLIYGLVARFSLRHYLTRLKYAAYSFAALAVMLTPLIFVQFTQGDDIKDDLAGLRSNIANEMNEYRAWPIDFVLPPKTNPILEHNQTFIHLNEVKAERSNPSESTNYVGIFIFVLVAIGILVFIYKLVSKKLRSHNGNTSNFFLIASISVIAIPLMVAFMLSPSINIFGVTIYLPGQLLLDGGVSYWRVMSRFFISLHVVMVLFACVSLVLVMKKIGFMNASGQLKKAGIFLVLAVWLITGLEYATTIGRPSFDVNDLPSGYQWLSRQDDIKVVAELPFVDPLDLRTSFYATAQIVHGKKLVNIKEPNIARVNNTTGSIDNPEAVNYVIERGAQAIILHTPKCQQGTEWGTLVHESESFEDNDRMCIYRIGRVVQGDDAFLVYKSGVVMSPRYKNNSEIVVNDAMILMAVTDESLVNSYDTKVQLDMNLYCIASGAWSVKQSEEELAKGLLHSGNNKITAQVNGAARFSLNIEKNATATTNQQCTIKNAIVSNLVL